MKGISVIIPCYNREKTISKAIESIIRQSYEGNFEIIVSDDGSTDNSIDIAKAYPNVTVLEKPEACDEQGAGAARNRGLKIAKFDYICFLDSDDYFLKEYLEKVCAALDAFPEFGYVYCKAKKETFRDIGVTIEDWTRVKLNYLDRKYHVLHRAFIINTNVIAVRKEVVQCVGYFDNSLYSGEDSDYWIRISEKYKGKFLDFFGAVYRINHSETQITKIESDAKLANSRKVYSKALNRIKKKDDSLRYFLVNRGLYYLDSSIGNAYIKHLSVNLKLLLLYPVSYFRYLYYVLFS